VSPSIYFSAFVFLVLFALLLLLSDQFSRASVPQPVLGSEKAIDGTALEKAAFVDQQPATNRNPQPDLTPVLTEFRRRLFGVGLFPSPVGVRLLSNDLPAESSIDTELKKTTRKLRGVQIHVKNHAHSLIGRKTVSRHRRAGSQRSTLARRGKSGLKRIHFRVAMNSAAPPK
jgi:hypothetical protein